MRYILSEPYRAYLYFPYLRNFNQKMQQMLTDYGLHHLDFTDVSLSISESLDQIHLPDFVVNFDEWLKTQPDSHSDRYTSYFKNDDNSWLPGLRNNNQYISQLAEHICDTTIANINNFLIRLIEEHKLLINIYNCPPLFSTPGKLSLAAGDRHNNGQQPVILALGSFKLIYKPRDSGIENVLNEICNIIGLAIQLGYELIFVICHNFHATHTSWLHYPSLCQTLGNKFHGSIDITSYGVFSENMTFLATPDGHSLSTHSVRHACKKMGNQTYRVKMISSLYRTETRDAMELILNTPRHFDEFVIFPNGKCLTMELF
ncbi:DUF4135 domain-containing protein [Dickeya dadantii]|uniref:DUF4135 domain-containing protein n=1 Tax=Dickeya dadantii TaxID=204038 RepID=UPI001495BD09|nr:DUF4135 domain-containing protein [Dickeya dadantii]MCL6407261.1 DUF4135 domain-containing protein [Dickeya dadantii]NPE50517.1 DUF4135 domain-containing protein [Dickeya dadantii]NPE56293.1 DUF4135 domain-containing protein [Dickeya dadantii]NPE66600.1 DUF4135 domain-containing protein [Dickeya dadantii]